MSRKNWLFRNPGESGTIKIKMMNGELVAMSDILSQGYPEYLQIMKVQYDIDGITVNLTSKRETAECPICGKISNKVNKKYIKTLNDMPTLGKITRSIITIHKYCCTMNTANRKLFLNLRRISLSSVKEEPFV